MGMLVSDCANPCHCGGVPINGGGTSAIVCTLDYNGGTSGSYGLNCYSIPSYNGPRDTKIVPAFGLTGSARFDWQYWDGQTYYYTSTYPQTCKGSFGALDNQGVDIWSIAIEGSCDGAGGMSVSYPGGDPFVGTVLAKIFDVLYNDPPNPPGYGGPLNPGGWMQTDRGFITNWPPSLGTFIF